LLKKYPLSACTRPVVRSGPGSSGREYGSLLQSGRSSAMSSSRWFGTDGRSVSNPVPRSSSHSRLARPAGEGIDRMTSQTCYLQPSVGLRNEQHLDATCCIALQIGWRSQALRQLGTIWGKVCHSQLHCLLHHRRHNASRFGLRMMGPIKSL
jgi:hypothetical protein